MLNQEKENIFRDRWWFRYLTVNIQAIDTAFVNDKLQEQAIRVELNRFQFPGLKIASLVGIEADVSHSLEFGARIGWAWIPFNRSANKNFDTSGDFALMW